jgi:hypothetical protein
MAAVVLGGDAALVYSTVQQLRHSAWRAVLGRLHATHVEAWQEPLCRAHINTSLPYAAAQTHQHIRGPAGPLTLHSWACCLPVTPLPCLCCTAEDDVMHITLTKLQPVS